MLVGQTMSDYYFDPRNVQEKFSIRVDWDTYLGEPGICHEEDVFFEDRPQEVSFYVFKNGDIASKFPVVSAKKTYLLKSDGKLLQSYGASWWLPFFTRIEFARAFTLIPDWEGRDLGPTESFYRCYLGSSNLNGHLTDSQKAIVERFFAAVRKTFPQEFAGK